MTNAEYFKTCNHDYLKYYLLLARARTGKRVRISKILMPVKNQSLNASANIPGFIFLNPVWEIVLTHEPPGGIAEKALLMTLGHEMAHKVGDFTYVFYQCLIKRPLSTQELKLVNWATEIHHDYYGAKWSHNDSAEDIRKIFEYKIGVKNALVGEDVAASSHPSLDFRMNCLLIHRSFDEQTLEFIAHEAGCDLSETSILREMILRHYGKMDLLQEH